MWGRESHILVEKKLWWKVSTKKAGVFSIDHFCAKQPMDSLKIVQLWYSCQSNMAGSRSLGAFHEISVQTVQGSVVCETFVARGDVMVVKANGARRIWYFSTLGEIGKLPEVG